MLMLVESEEEPQKVADQLKKNSKKMGLKKNNKKAKTMLVSRDHEKDRRNGVDRHVCIKMNGQILEQVKKFKSMAQWIKENGLCDLEVKTRIEMARSAFKKLRDVNIKICYFEYMEMFGLVLRAINISVSSGVLDFE